MELLLQIKNGGKAIYNDSEIEISNAKVIISNDDSIGLYCADNAKNCVIKNTEITVEAEVIENYELIKDTDEFKAELENKKPSYAICNDSKSTITIETATIKAERLKSVGIINKSEGTIILGVEDETVNNESPIIYAISDNTTGIINSEKGVINFYDGRIITTNSIKNMITRVLNNYEIGEDITANTINTTLKLITVEKTSKSDENNSTDSSLEENKADSKLSVE